MRGLTVGMLTIFLAITAFAQKNTPFAPGCPLPFTGTSHDIDDRCGIEGSSGNNAKHNAASTAKNDFCATNSPFALTLAVFDRLQQRAETEQIPTGPNQYPDDRDDLKEISTLNGVRIGEGDRVRIVAWVMKAKYSNDKPRKKGKNGEHVNCNHQGEEWNDIHIALAANKNDSECATITAEMSPHFRPEQWTPENLTNLQFPVRVTGHLLYDSIHRPCENGKGSPKRRSSWEIHPVYAVDVCSKKSIAQCPVNGGANIWTPLVQFILDEEEEDAHVDDDEG